MVKCSVIKDFTLEQYNLLKNIKRAKFDIKNRLYVGDTFECNKELAEYLNGNNKENEVVVKILEVKPKKKEK